MDRGRMAIALGGEGGGYTANPPIRVKNIVSLLSNDSNAIYLIQIISQVILVNDIVQPPLKIVVGVY